MTYRIEHAYPTDRQHLAARLNARNLDVMAPLSLSLSLSLSLLSLNLLKYNYKESRTLAREYRLFLQLCKGGLLFCTYIPEPSNNLNHE